MPSTVVVMLRCFAAVLVAVGLAGPAAGANLVTIDGERVSGKIEKIESGQVFLAGRQKPLELDRLRSIGIRPHAKLPLQLGSKSILQLTGRGRVLADGLTIQDQACQFRWAYGQQARLPLEAVRAVQLNPDKIPEDFAQAVRKPLEASDQIFLTIDGNPQTLQGVIEQLTDKQMTFEWQGQTRTVPRASVVGIVLASLGTTDRTGQCLLHLRDGSAVWGKLTGLAKDTARLEVAEGVELDIPWDAVNEVNVRSSRMVFLSDLDPVEVKEKPIVTFARPWQRDQSAAKGPLRLGGRTFEKGIGVHARSELAFAAGKKYRRLSGTIGIDEGTGGRGDCVFVVRGDGKELFRRRVTGGDDPAELSVDVSGVDELRLIVEPGENLDLADHANWCDIRLLRDPLKK